MCSDADGALGVMQRGNSEMLRGLFQRRSHVDDARLSTTSSRDASSQLKILIKSQLNCFDATNDKPLYLKLAAADGLVTPLLNLDPFCMCDH